MSRRASVVRQRLVGRARRLRGDGTLPVGAELQRIAVDPDGRWVYTFDYEDYPILIAVDPVTRTAVTLTLPERLRGLAADAGHAYVGWPNWIEDGSNVVARIETEEAAIGSLGTVVDETQALPSRSFLPLPTTSSTAPAATTSAIARTTPASSDTA